MSASNTKISGKLLTEFHGLAIYGKLMMPKRRGKMRVLIQLRSDKQNDLLVSQSLSYTRAVDVHFATYTDRNNKGLIV
jgi:hypothetical protein